MTNSKYTVLKNQINGEFGIIRTENIGTIKYCESFYMGNPVGCDTAGCVDDEHEEVRAYTYWDGSNHQSIILDDYNQWKELAANDETALEIISEMPEEPCYDGASEEIETEHHKYLFTRWASDPFICTVDHEEY